jgi:DNA-binding MarR family transcriptional regulator
MSHPPADAEQVVDALLQSSRALVGVAARSLADLDDVTLPQWRSLVLISSRERTTVSDLAADLGVHPTTATRLCDRLVRKRLIRRTEAQEDRRQTVLQLTAAGGRLVDRVTAARRADIAAIAARMAPGELHHAVDALHAFATAAGGVVPHADLFGWDVPTR